MAPHEAPPTVAVVPIRMTEAWLLLDEGRIRRVAGNPNGRTDLGLPRLSDVESVADPKRLLQGALISASGLQGHRLRKFRERFNDHRRRLLEGLDLDGPVTELSGWKALQRSLTAALARLG